MALFFWMRSIKSRRAAKSAALKSPVRACSAIYCRWLRHSGQHQIRNDQNRSYPVYRQGRFPIRVELDSLSIEDFESILVRTDASLVKQYQALLGTENVRLDFLTDGI